MHAARAPGTNITAAERAVEKDDLKKSLRHLHAELEASTAVDEEAVGLMRDVLEDMRRLLENAASDRDEEEEPEGLRERVDELATRLEADHPRLVETARELVSALSTMGI